MKSKKEFVDLKDLMLDRDEEIVGLRFWPEKGKRSAYNLDDSCGNISCLKE